MLVFVRYNAWFYIVWLVTLLCLGIDRQVLAMLFACAHMHARGNSKVWDVMHITRIYLTMPLRVCNLLDIR